MDPRIIQPRPVLAGPAAYLPRPTRDLPNPELLKKAEKENLYQLYAVLLDRIPPDLREFVDTPGSDAFEQGAEAVLTALFIKMEKRLNAKFHNDEQRLKKGVFSRLSALAKRVDQERNSLLTRKKVQLSKLAKERDSEIKKAIQQVKQRYAEKIKEAEALLSDDSSVKALIDEDKKIKSQFEEDLKNLGNRLSAYLTAIGYLRRFYKIHS